MKPVNQNETPILDSLMNYVNEKTIPFHVPGHKQGRGNKALTSILSSTALSIDLSCMEDLDNICNPKSVIKEAENLAADLYQQKMLFPC